MNKISLFLMTLLCLAIVEVGFCQNNSDSSDDGWISLFDGESLDGWKVGENASTFSVEDGTIKVEGPRAHLYYAGDVENHDFENFELKARVMTRSQANSGIYFHTEYKPDGWPVKGYEVQVNNSHRDWRRTGSLYNIVNVREQYVKDNEWFTEYIKVKSNRVIVKINGITMVDYTEPENPEREGERVHRILSSGTFALQGHDPNSVIYFKDIKVRPLDD
ncbi:3-keto-disaccharide hydrolase [Fodinibius sediminis]|uniref:3-keto-alpha-glucoside-1,2-lyase/3-keto-2-hydroxy-glucal hydratase domain-containing protein n=1 Tax=Fodinibius sediminis TaxID=1214077 RepID=A0A521AVD5_9BACT|nr:DUF1080 domain-containing protein [Fodinibius sediminis]SMO38777.1 protein of unknown function [Fodinibius sediminis]